MDTTIKGTAGASKAPAMDAPSPVSTFTLIKTGIIIIALLYGFLVGVGLLSSSIKLMGGGFAKGLLEISSHPMLGLLSGILATSLFQSSSVTTSIVVGMVSSGSITIAGAVPIIMGANIGTTVTNTLASMGYMRDNTGFKKAFAAATIHDFFNFLAVASLLPLELMTGFLEKSATWSANMLYGTSAGFKFKSPIKAAIKPAVKGVKGFITDTLGFTGISAGTILALVAAAVIVICLTYLVKNSKVLVESKVKDVIDGILSKNAVIAIIMGMLFTIMVQSSSITTSMLVPMAGAGLVSLKAIFPVTLGANIGTTTTALLAAMAGNVAGLAIALVHLFFNLAGILLWFPIPFLRQVPIKLAEGFAEIASKKKKYAILYIMVAYFGIPLLVVMVTK